jgi:hypothetical protein
LTDFILAVQQQQMEKLQMILEAMKMPQIQQDLEDIRRRIAENSKSIKTSLS